MKDPRDTAIRYLTTLSLIPVEPGKIAPSTLQEKLSERGFEVDIRTLQRDLKDKLSNYFPLVCDDSSRPFRWSFVKGAFFDLPAMDTASALAYYLAEEQLRSLLPQSVADQLSPQFNAARQFLTNLNEENGLANWVKKVRALPNSKALIPARISEETWRATTEALLHNKQIKVKYLSRGQGKRTSLQLHPAGLVSRYSVTYLIARVEGFEDLRHYALHRIKHCEILEQDASIKKSFNLDKHIAEGRFSWREQTKKVTLIADIAPSIAWLLNETPISKKQSIEPLPADSNAPQDWQRLTALVGMDKETLWWVYAMNHQIRLHAPEEWVEEIKQSLKSLSEGYQLS